MKFNTFTRKSELIKTRLTKVLNECKAVADQHLEGTPINRHLQEKLITFEELSKEKYNEFEELLEQVTSEADETEDSDYDGDAVSKLQEEIFDLYVNISSYVKSTRPQPQQTQQQQAPVPAAVVVTADQPAQVQSVSSAVRLPRLEIPTFNGDLNLWMTYYNIFNTTIIENTTISDVQKFQYLLTSLQGQALNSVRQLPLTAANFKIAWDLLCQRYHNKRRLMNLHLNKVIDLPNVPKNSLKALRSFLSTYEENVQALQALEIDVTCEESSPLLVTLLLRKIDVSLRKKFEDNRTEHDLPSVQDLMAFLENECICTEDSYYLNPTDHVKFSDDVKPQSRSSGYTSTPYHQGNSQNKTKTALFVSPTLSCYCCNDQTHTIYSCPKFLAMSPQDKYQFIKDNNGCTNCLGASHKVSTCDSKYSCRKCFKRHHTFIHMDSPPNNKTESNSNKDHKNTGRANKPTNKPFTSPASSSSQISKGITDKPSTNSENNNTASKVVSALSSEVSQVPSRVLLGTALIKVSHNGNTQVLRGVLDSAAMATFISQRAAHLLGVKRSYSPKCIQGISSTQVKALGCTELTVSSLDDEFVFKSVQCLILDKVTSNLPDVPISKEVKEKMKPFVLADPTFDLPSPIDILIGADLFPQLMTGKIFKLGLNLPSAVGTLFGYVLMGNAPTYSAQKGNLASNLTLLFIQDKQLNETILKFWQSEEPPSHNVKSEEDQFCENYFEKTCSRDETGRFVVRLPQKEDISLGESSFIAQRQFLAQEKRLSEQPELKKLYHEFMNDYKECEHMKIFTPSTNDNKYYLPHHGVLKANSTTTKLRVVFNASQKTSNGFSLNDKLLAGPKLQNDIGDVILNFRHHSVVFVCDIKQMYRQIKVHEDDQPNQLIYWRNHPEEPLETYALTTVTYGMSCSPYLAIRTLKQLVKEEGAVYPNASAVLNSQIYMDDILAGSTSIEKAIQLRDELTELLQLGGFKLRKWISNQPQLLQSLPEDHKETPLQFTNLNQPLFNVLGLHWNPDTDTFYYKIDITGQDNDSHTKRSVLSTLARLYDPCGFLSPVLFWAKSFIQLLWTQGLKWDEPLSLELLRKWELFLQDLPKLEEIFVPRPILTDTAKQVQLHGFCDASELGYAACVYVRTCDESGHVTLRLLYAKSRVAPLKKVSLPRLELNGAHLLAMLIHYCQGVMLENIKIESIHAWCDSTVTLAWIKTPPYKLRTYIGNRVAQIQEWSPPEIWRHVKSTENPADCSSRGLLPNQVINHPLWWSGPEWIYEQPENWPKLTNPEKLEESDIPEMKNPTSSMVANTVQLPENTLQDTLTQYSSWTKLQSVMTWTLRFIHNCRSKDKRQGNITYDESNNATKAICRLIQEEKFSNDITNLKRGQMCSTQIRRLNPFLDEDNLIRVGGRIRNSQLDNEAKHPILLPKHHPVTNLIIDYFHTKHLHCGPQLLQSLIRQKFWILSARSVIRSRVFRCHRCFRCKPTNKPPLMGDLPESRLKPARPFSKTGVDFGGPIQIKMHLMRRIQQVKAYLCVFVCFVTKAVHIEVVTDLTSEAFIAALTRFTSRRGICKDIYSDCGTNFVGAANHLKKVTQELFDKEDTRHSLQQYSKEHGINFHFNPPAAPHQGGLWESAVKSVKYHLLRVIGDYILTLEELITLTTKVEAILNSRPITANSSDPSEPSALTPGHFLVGGPLVGLPELKIDEIPLNRLRRWQVVQNLTQRLWKRWSLEYLHSLQERNKWTEKHPSFQVGDVVIIHDPDAPPLRWNTGRIERIFPGSDGVVRVVEVKTQKALLRRPATKVYKLPE